MAQSSSFTVSYSGSVKSYTLAAGTWLITLVGAGGGGNWSGSYSSANGSAGGRIQQRVKFTADTTVYVVVGGAGSTGGSGGYNGGGNSSGGSSSSGGGATHVANKTGLITSLTTSNLYCVAAGGGGAGGIPWLYDGESYSSSNRCTNGSTWNSSYTNGSSNAGAAAATSSNKWICDGKTFYGGGGGAGVPGGGSYSTYGSSWASKRGYGGKNYVKTGTFGNATLTSVANSQSAGAAKQTNGSATFTFESPAMSSPTTATINTSCYKYLYLRWSGQTGTISSYNIQIAVNGNTSNPISTSTANGYLNYDISGYAAGTTFSFRVQANGVSTWSGWSSTSTRKSINTAGSLKASDINNAQDVAAAMVTPLGGTFSKAAVTAGNKIARTKIADMATYANGRWSISLSINSTKPIASEWQALLNRL